MLAACNRPLALRIQRVILGVLNIRVGSFCMNPPKLKAIECSADGAMPTN
jgi:hypothetical protein